MKQFLHFPIHQRDNFSILSFRGMIDPSNQHLEWHSPPQNVLIIKKHMDQDVTKQFKEMVKWLMTVSLIYPVFFVDTPSRF